MYFPNDDDHFASKQVQLRRGIRPGHSELAKAQAD